MKDILLIVGFIVYLGGGMIAVAYYVVTSEEPMTSKLTRHLVVGDVLIAPFRGTVSSVARSKNMIEGPDGAALAFEIELDTGERLISHPRAIHKLTASAVAPTAKNQSETF